MSLVGPPDAILHKRIIEMSQKGVVFIAAAGNSGLGAPPAYPAAYSNEVIAVTAVDRDGRNYADANQGKYIDVAAPGVRIWTALPGNREGALSGTSFATPFVTAIAASIYNSTPLRAMHDGKGPMLNPKQVMLSRFAIEKVAGGGRDPIFGLGYARAPETCSPPAKAPPPAMVEQAPAVQPVAAAARPLQASAQRADVAKQDWQATTVVRTAAP
jgi:subtilisin family serine protease